MKKPKLSDIFYDIDMKLVEYERIKKGLENAGGFEVITSDSNKKTANKD